MKNILKEEIDQIKYLFDYRKSVVISEQDANAQATKNYTIQDIQQKLVDLGYKDQLSNSGKIKNPVDGKFGPSTLNAITQAIRTSKTQEPTTPTPNSQGVRTTSDTQQVSGSKITTKDTTKLTTSKPEIKTNQPALSLENQAASSQWCKDNTIPNDPYFEKCFAGTGTKEKDARKSLNDNIVKFNTENNVRYKNRRATYWDAANSTIYEVWSTATLDEKTKQNRQNVLASMRKGTQNAQPQQASA